MKKLFAFLGTTALLLILAPNATASEGQTILTNKVGGSSTCWVGSVIMQSDSYSMLFSCRDIIYPGGTEVFSYVLWANPTNGGNAIKLGIIGYGKGSFKTNTAFSSLFITKEANSNSKTPTGAVVMQGTVGALPGLQNNNGTGTTQPQAQPKATQTPEGQATVEPTPQPRTGIARFLTSGILAILGIAGIIFVVFIITKK